MVGFSDNFEVLEGRIKGWLDDLHLPLRNATFVWDETANYLVYELSKDWSVFVYISRCFKKDSKFLMQDNFSHFGLCGAIQKTTEVGQPGRDLADGKASRKILSAIFAGAAVAVASAGRSM